MRPGSARAGRARSTNSSTRPTPPASDRAANARGNGASFRERAARMLLTAIAIIAGVFLLLLALIWWGQEKLVYFPQPGPYDHPAEVHRIDYFAADRQPLLAYVIGDPAAARGVMLCFHGNADLSVHQVDWAREVHRRTGYAVALAEYRGYMGLGGKPTYEGLQLDAEAAYDMVRSRLGVDSSRITFFGYSLGSAVAAELALEHEPRTLLLQAPFTSA